MIQVEESKIKALKSNPNYGYAKGDILKLFEHYKEKNERQGLSNAHLNKTLFWMSVENYLETVKNPWEMSEDKRQDLADKAYADACGTYISLRGEEFHKRQEESPYSHDSAEYAAIREELIEEEEDFSYESFDD